MVERAAPVISETSLIPPRPKLRASAAASNLRPRSSRYGDRASYRYLIPSVLSIHNIWRANPHYGIPFNHPRDPSVISPNRPGSFRHPREHQKPAAVPENPGKLSDRKPAPGPLQLPPASSGPTILPPLPTASHTAPGRVADFRSQRNGTVAQASPAVRHGRQKDQRRLSSLQMVARIKKREDEKTLNQESGIRQISIR